MSAPVQLPTQSRQGTGSAAARRERAAGRVPVVVYGHGQPPVSLTVDEHDLTLALHTSAQVFMLGIDSQQESCLVKDVQWGVFGQKVLHVDFTRIDLSEEVEVEVALEFRGDAKGVLAGGTQSVHHPALAVRCRADSIPDLIVVDVSGVELNGALHAGEIALPAGVSLDEDAMGADEPIFSVHAPRVEAAPEGAAEEGAAAEPGAAPAEGGEARSED